MLRSSVSTNKIDDHTSKNVDVKIPLNILGITSSDSYYRMSMIDSENDKLKKKMKNKKNKKSKEKSKELIEDEDEEDERPKVAITADEMPDGARLSDDDGSKKLDANDPHRLLDINLDE